MTISKTQQEENRKKYDAMSKEEKHEHHMQSMARVRAERIAKRDPNAIIKTLLDEKKNEAYEGVAIGGHIEPANNWYKENTYLLMDLSSVHAHGLSARIADEIVKPINDYLFERTGTNIFGDLKIQDEKVISFKEKPQSEQGWINGGYFIFEPEIFDYLNDDLTILEKEPLENLAKDGELMAYQHEGLWQCMDTIRDRDLLNRLIFDKNTPWLK